MGCHASVVRHGPLSTLFRPTAKSQVGTMGQREKQPKKFWTWLAIEAAIAMGFVGLGILFMN